MDGLYWSMGGSEGGMEEAECIEFGHICWNGQEFEPPSTVLPLEFFFEVGRGLGG